MTKKLAKKLQCPITLGTVDFQSPVDAFLYIMGGKWRADILYSLHVLEKPRFTEIQKFLGISSKVLAQEIKKLESCDVIRKKIISTSPEITVYEFHPTTMKVEPIFEAIFAWGSEISGKDFSAIIQKKKAERATEKNK